jgi:hypothetical protein
MIFQPTFWSKERKIILTVLLVLTIIAFFFISRSVMEFYYELGLVRELKNVIVMSLSVFAALWVVPIAASLWTVRHQSIEINKGLLTSRSQLMLHKPIYTMINMKTVELIKDREEKKVVPTGKSFTVITLYYLIFAHSHGQKQEISLVGWDKESVKEVLLYIKRKYPEIFIQTYAYREPSEELLKDYLPHRHQNS